MQDILWFGSPSLKLLPRAKGCFGHDIEMTASDLQEPQDDGRRSANVAELCGPQSMRMVRTVYPASFYSHGARSRRSRSMMRPPGCGGTSATIVRCGSPGGLRWDGR